MNTMYCMTEEITRTNKARRAIAVVAAAVLFALGLLFAGKAALAETSGESETESAQTGESPPLTDVGELAANTEAQDDEVTQASSVTAESTPQWISGPTSNTYYWHPVLWQVELLTTEYVSYYGATDASYPKVGDTYYGAVTVANVNPGNPAFASPEITLPANTKFDINPSNPDKKVRCYLGKFETGEYFETNDCPQTPFQGTYGKYFPPQEAPHEGYWALPPGWFVEIHFPLVSSAPLKGLANVPPDCLIGSIWVGNSIGLWDAPQSGDRCPLPKDHGVYQGVFVSPSGSTSQPPPGVTNLEQCRAYFAADGKLTKKEKRKCNRWF
jgi:hypothetical protein